MGIIKDSGFVVDEKSSKVLSKFNWGAFGFTYFWGLGNGAFRKTVPILICDLLTGIPILNILAIIAGLILKIFAGINGNRWAYEGRAWYNAEDFEDTQKRYATAFAVIFAIGVVCIILFYSVLLAIILTYSKGASPIGNGSNPSKISAGSPLEEVVDDVIKRQTRNGEFGSGIEIADYILTNSEFANKNSGKMVPAKYTSNSVKFVSANNPKFIYYTFLFVKDGKCNLKQKNCSVTMYQMGKPAGKIYYDNKGNKKQVKVVTKK